MSNSFQKKMKNRNFYIKSIFKKIDFDITQKLITVLITSRHSRFSLNIYAN